jgi:Flp pilus assembly protein CpaB
VAGILALLAGGALLLFLQAYRNDLTNSDPVRVLVARSLVPKGTPGGVVTGDRLYKLVRVKKSQLKDGAITDPEALEGKVASEDIFPGHQLRAGDFEAAKGKTGSHLSGYDRAMTVPVDQAHGMIGRIERGDRVDVITTISGGVGSATTARIAARDVLVIDMPSGDKGGVGESDQPVTLRVSDEEAAGIAAAADGGKVWLVLRPAVRARSHETSEAVARALSEGRLDADIDIDVRGRR